jgi:hypothetical protein
VFDCCRGYAPYFAMLINKDSDFFYIPYLDYHLDL